MIADAPTGAPAAEEPARRHGARSSARSSRSRDAAPASRIWRDSRLDATLLAISMAQLGATFLLASRWEGASGSARVGAFGLLVAMAIYNVIVVSHLFAHRAWFSLPALNSLVSMLNSVNTGQSVQAYRLTHVRNHHRFNNDPRGADGTTKDLSSTFRDGRDGGHAGLGRYALLGAADTLGSSLRAVLCAHRLWGVGAHETVIRSLAANGQRRRALELRQVRLDRMAQLAALCAFVAIDWQWTLLCYLPALYTSFALVNVQNYYEHYHAIPTSRCADSVSYYGRLYNLVAFNDGYHQEHHLRPQAHWSQLPTVREELAAELALADRVVSPVPALLRFAHRARRPPNAGAAAGADIEGAG
jgi:fatty acid desaturase